MPSNKSWHGKGNRGESVCVELYCSEMLGADTHDCCPIQMEREVRQPTVNMLCPGRLACS